MTRRGAVTAATTEEADRADDAARGEGDAVHAAVLRRPQEGGVDGVALRRRLHGVQMGGEVGVHRYASCYVYGAAAIGSGFVVLRLPFGRALRLVFECRAAQLKGIASISGGPLAPFPMGSEALLSFMEAS